jgi:hypothetical protein
MTIYAKTTFEGFHRWKDAPLEVDFLRNWHRHIFHVLAVIIVTNDNRQVEFIQLKHKIDAFLAIEYAGKYFEESCEMIARNTAAFLASTGFTVGSVTVNEDDENGAIYLPLSKV